MRRLCLDHPDHGRDMVKHLARRDWNPIPFRRHHPTPSLFCQFVPDRLVGRGETERCAGGIRFQR